MEPLMEEKPASTSPCVVNDGEHAFLQIPVAYTGYMYIYNNNSTMVGWASYKNGRLHSSDPETPTRVYSNGRKEWYKDGVLQKFQGTPPVINVKSGYGAPTDYTGTLCVVDDHGIKQSEYTLENNIKHCLDGPAYVKDTLHVYSIKGCPLSKEEWEKHPQVIEHKKKEKKTEPVSEPIFFRVPPGKIPDHYTGCVYFLDNAGSIHAKIWYNNGIIHRENGPAVENALGSKLWHLKGKVHRLDGPAVEDADGSERYYVDDFVLSKEEWEKHPKVIEFNNSKAIERLKQEYFDSIKRLNPDMTVVTSLSNEERKNFTGIHVESIGVVRYYKDGLLHNLTGPAYYNNEKHELEYWIEGINFSEASFEKQLKNPSLFVDSFENVPQDYTGEVFRPGDEFRSSRWYANGKLHRINGPAISCPGGKEYYYNGQRSRLDGPAVELADFGGYWVMDKQLTKEQWEKDPLVLYYQDYLKKSQKTKIESTEEMQKFLAEFKDQIVVTTEASKKEPTLDELIKELLNVEEDISPLEFWNSPTVIELLKKKYEGNHIHLQEEQIIPQNFTGIAFRDAGDTIEFYKNGLLDGEDVHPSVISSRRLRWHTKGNLHSTTGPAVEDYDESGYILSYGYYQDGRLHCEDGPAIQSYISTIKESFWVKGIELSPREHEQYVNGELTIRINQPITDAYVVSLGCDVTHYTNGLINWRKNGLLHREDGPAIENVSGDKEWWINGHRHREDGPAVINPGGMGNGTKIWCQYDRVHSLDGPAIERINGTKEWRVDGQFLTKEDWLKHPKVIEHNKSIEKHPIIICLDADDDFFSDHDFTGVAIDHEQVCFYHEGVPHRIDGPAMFYHIDVNETDETQDQYWINGSYFFKEDYEQQPQVKKRREFQPDDRVWIKEYLEKNNLFQENNPSINESSGYNDESKNDSNVNTLNLKGNESMAVDFQNEAAIPKNFTGTARLVSGTLQHYYNGLKHKTDGPAVEHCSGTKNWYQNGKLHRIGGPAVERTNSRQPNEYYQDGKLHREDGPAKVFPNGSKEYFLQDKQLDSKYFFAKEAADLALKNNAAAILQFALQQITTIPSAFKSAYMELVKNTPVELLTQNKAVLDHVLMTAGKAAVGITPMVEAERTLVGFISQTSGFKNPIVNILGNTAIPVSFTGIVNGNDTRQYYKNGQLHRTDGPAVENADGSKMYFIDGNQYSEENWKKAIFPLQTSKEDLKSPVETTGKKPTLKPSLFPELKEATEKMEVTGKSTMMSRAKDQVKKDFSAASVRVAAKQITKMVQKLIVQVSTSESKNGQKLDKRTIKKIQDGLSAFFATEMGEITVSMSIGSLIPLLKERLPVRYQPHLEALATEFRVQAFAEAGNKVMEIVTGPGFDMAKMMVTAAMDEMQSRNEDETSSFAEPVRVETSAPKSSYVPSTNEDETILHETQTLANALSGTSS